MTHTNGHEDDAGRREGGERRGRAWERWGLLIAIVVAAYGIYDARVNKDQLVESQQKIAEIIAAKNLAEQQKSAAETRASQLGTENAKLQSVNIDRLLQLYGEHLSAIQKAASHYEELRKQPDNSDTIPQKAAAQRELNSQVAAFTQFVAKWRAFAETLGKILDGNVQRMDDARQNNNPDDIEDALRTLQNQFPDLRQMLDTQLGQIASG